MMTLVNIQWIRVKQVFTLNNINISLVLITLTILNNNKINPHDINYLNVYFRAMLHLLHVSSSIKSKNSFISSNEAVNINRYITQLCNLSHIV